ncbi:MAG: GntR family transcriptional regulator [Pseudomonadota bacterium]
MADAHTAERSQERDRAPTLGEQVYDRLRADIINGTLAAGQPLRLVALRARYGAGFSPLREALSRLRSERLVMLEEQKGFRVAPVSIAEMWDAIETRVLIESDALRRSIERGDEAWEVGIVARFHALSSRAARYAAQGVQLGPDELQELEARHHAFHSALISAAGSAWLTEFAEQLSVQTERYRYPLLNGATAGGQRDLHAEHQQLMELSLARRADEAVAHLAEHYRRTGKLIEHHFAERAERAA